MRPSECWDRPVDRDCGSSLISGSAGRLREARRARCSPRPDVEPSPVLPIRSAGEQAGIRCPTRLEYSQEHSESPYGAIGHSARGKGPRVLLAFYDLAEFYCLLCPQRLGAGVRHTRHDAKNSLRSLSRFRSKLVQHACRVASIAPQDIARIRWLHCRYCTRIEIIHLDPRQKRQIPAETRECPTRSPGTTDPEAPRKSAKMML